MQVRPPFLAEPGGGSLAAIAALVTAITSSVAPNPLPAQEATGGGDDRASRAAEIVETAREKRYERWEGVDNYTIYGTFRGADVVHYHEKITVDGRPAFRIVPPHEYEGDELERAGLSNGFPPAGAGGPAAGPPGEAPGNALPGAPGEALPGLGELPVPEGVRGAAETVSGVADRVGEARDAVTDNPIGRAASGAATGGLQRELMQRGAEGLMGAMGDDGTAEAMASARTEAKMFEAMGRVARFAGTENVGGREAYVLVADDLTEVDLGAASGAATDMRVRSAKIWLDTEEYVSLKSEMEIISGRGTPPMTVEVDNRDYRSVDGLYEPFERTIRSGGMAGMMGGGSEMQQKMQQGMEQMEQMRERMEDMPPAQRRMFERQMEQMEEMGGGPGGAAMGASTIEMSTEEIVVNQGPPTKHGRGTIVVSGGATAELSHTIATAGSGPHPSGDGALSMLQLVGGADAEANEASAMLQLNIPGALPDPGTISGQGALTLHWDDGRQGTFQAEEVAITVTSRTSRHIRGEYSMQAEGYLVDSPGDEPSAATVTVEGGFLAVLPRAASRGARHRPTGAGARPTPMMPGAGGMQP